MKVFVVLIILIFFFFVGMGIRSISLRPVAIPAVETKSFISIVPSLYPTATPSTVPTFPPQTPTIEPTTTLQEAGSMEESRHPQWWVSSGGKVLLRQQTFSTILGALNEEDRWYQLYQQSNPHDTDKGSHPQNIFRLVTKKKIENSIQRVYFRIQNNHFSESSNRNESNGVLFFIRYQDADTLYYAGLRVDGQAVIKKKSLGTYETLGIRPVLPGASYNRTSNPNLLRKNYWYGMQAQAETLTDGTVRIILSIDLDGSLQFNKVLDVIDGFPEKEYRSLRGSGHGGIRTDFMDVEFKNYQFEPI